MRLEVRLRPVGGPPIAPGSSGPVAWVAPLSWESFKEENSMRTGTLTLFVTAGFILPCGLIYGNDGEDGDRSSRLTPPDGAPFPNARGEVELGGITLKVEVEGLGAGDYQVLLDDGTGTKQPIGTITVKTEEPDDEKDESVGEDHEDEHEDDEHEDTEGSLRLSGDQLPFGAKTAGELSGRDICVVDKDSKVVLAGKTPATIPDSTEPDDEKSARCPLVRPHAAGDAGAERARELGP